MTRTLQNMYVVVTGDLRSSRRLKDRAKVQEELKNALRIVNRRFNEEIPAKFIVVGGDSFQGMLFAPKYLFDIYYVFFDFVSQNWLTGENNPKMADKEEWRLLRKSLLAGILEEEARENSYNLNFVIDR